MLKNKMNKTVDIGQAAHFSLRKLSVGLASVLISTSLYFLSSNAQVAHADTIAPDTTTQQVTDHAKTNDTEQAKENATNQNTVVTKPDTTTTNTSTNTNQDTTNTTTDNNSKDTEHKDTNQPTSIADDKTSKSKVKVQTDEPKADWYDYDTNTDTLTLHGKKTFTNPGYLFGLDSQYGSKVKHINIADKVTLIGSARGLFADLPNLTDITGLNNLDTSQVTDMSQMFQDCPNLTEIDVSNFDTSNVVDMSTMFANSGINKIDISHFNLNSVTSMSNMFEYCDNLTKFDLSNHIAPKLVDMVNMFQECQNLISVDLSNFVTGSNARLERVFSCCYNLESVNLDGFELNRPGLDANEDAPEQSSIEGMFDECNKLIKADFSKAKISNLASASMLFSECYALRDVDLSGIDLTGEYTDISNMFDSVRNLRSLTLGPKSVLQNNYSSDINFWDMEEGLWLNKGSGTLRHPQGTKIWTTEEFTEKYQPGVDADTYIRLFDFKVHFVDQDNNNKDIDGIGPITVEQPALAQAGTDVHIPYFTVEHTDEMKVLAADAEAKGYKLVSNPFKDTSTLHPDLSNMDIYYVFKQLSDPKEETLDKEYTVHFVDSNGKQLAPDHVQKVHFTRTVQVSRVTGKVMDDTIPWQAASEYYEDVAVPAIAGYVPNSKTANGVKVVKGKISNVKIEPGKDVADSVIYTAQNSNTGDTGGSTVVLPSHPDSNGNNDHEPGKGPDEKPTPTPAPKPTKQPHKKPTKPTKPTATKPAQPASTATNAATVPPKATSMPAAAINTTNLVKPKKAVLPQTGTKDNQTSNWLIGIFGLVMLLLGTSAAGREFSKRKK